MKLRSFFVSLLTLSALAVSAGRPAVVAHRGYWNTPGSAQNSITALVKADSIGADAVELDVWLSADNVLYVNHDAEVDGVVIETATSKQLSKCKLSNGEKVPTLDAFLEKARALKPDLVVEVKPHKDPRRENVAVPMIIDMVKDKGLTDRVSYITFSRNAFDDLVTLSGRPVQYLNGISPSLLAELGGAGADYHINEFRTHPEWIGQLHDLGKTANIWTVNKPDEIEFCIEKGADFITTDEPVLAAELIEKAYGKRELTIMTYNIRFGELSDMEGLAREIREHKPDFVALQEVDIMTKRDLARHNNGLSYINELAQKTGMFGYYGRTVTFSNGGYYGIGMLSKYPAEKLEKIDLPNPKNVEPRVLLEGTFELPGQKFIFACTHLDYIDAETRKMQARFIMNAIKDAKYPLILAGDFNATPDEEAYYVFNYNMLDLTNKVPTWPAEDPRDKLDYIFAYPAQDFEFISTFVPEVKPKPASDHLYIVSKVKF